MKMFRVIMMMVMAMVVGVALGNIVDTTCKQTPDYTLCLSLLRSDPRSSSADTVGLGLILVDKIKALGTETLGQINAAYKTKPMLKRALDECNLRYKTIVDVDVHTAITAINGNPKFAEGAVVDAGVEASVCAGGFPKGQSPLTGLTQRMNKICDVTRAIIRMLL
ncbi:PREDICTED: cell wall / vacuolar inhibitor of fructosidase 1-like [Camelina sativa]|uniref:Cell wall / vacuolar inhibitor of fructosidase 1-like n=1 Tax=Camelina sativa TaxID=90675 RepID=A0ABM0XL73_CAMSA|nr:PREDICTED: cell wall / vacuolar inhibitor of fructosidase 1-like [Camelina sativa]